MPVSCYLCFPATPFWLTKIPSWDRVRLNAKKKNPSWDQVQAKSNVCVWQRSRWFPFPLLLVLCLLYVYLLSGPLLDVLFARILCYMCPFSCIPIYVYLVLPSFLLALSSLLLSFVFLLFSYLFPSIPFFCSHFCPPILSNNDYDVVAKW